MPKSVRGVMHEFKDGDLHSGSSSGPVVKKRSQAIAIALHEQRKQGKSTALMVRERAGQHPHRNLGKYLHPKKG